jgi:hypothetical protein
MFEGFKKGKLLKLVEYVPNCHILGCFFSNDVDNCIVKLREADAIHFFGILFSINSNNSSKGRLIFILFNP